MDRLRVLREKTVPFFMVEELAEALGLPLPSARVLASRKTAAGMFIRVRRNLYVLQERFQNLSQNELFQLANILQTPSYVSFLSALAFHECTTQVIQSVVESANPIRSRSFETRTVTFRYLFCREPFYFGYTKEKDFFIAEPEKALIDALYFQSLKRYALDESALDVKTLNWRQAEKWLRHYPLSFQTYFNVWRKQWKI